MGHSIAFLASLRIAIAAGEVGNACFWLLQVRSENGTTFNHNEIGEYNIVLVFECVVEDEFSAEYIKQYNKEGYNLAHTPERFTLK